MIGLPEFIHDPENSYVLLDLLLSRVWRQLVIANEKIDLIIKFAGLTLGCLHVLSYSSAILQKSGHKKRVCSRAQERTKLTSSHVFCDLGYDMFFL